MALDAEKAFNQLEWTYLFKVLEMFEFPEEITTTIKTIYKSPAAQVYVNGTLSEIFRLKRGT